jgi:Outer membrane lipoprotein carrier protein LolA
VNKTKKIFLKGLFLFLLGLGNVYANDTLLGLMQKLKSEPMDKVAYQETRKLKLMKDPWHGSGYLYSQSPDLMIKEQVKPERLLMGMKGNKAFYFDPKNNERHQSDIGSDDEINLPLSLFKALVNADEPLLRSLFHIVFSSGAQSWTMDLKPKQKAGSVSSIIVTGHPGQHANKISVMQEDGDMSEFNLHKDVDGSHSKDAISKLSQELLGE